MLTSFFRLPTNIFETLLEKAFPVLWTEEYLINLLSHFSLKPTDNLRDLIINFLRKNKLNWRSFSDLTIANKLTFTVMNGLRKIKKIDVLPKSERDKLTKDFLVIKYLEKERGKYSKTILKSLVKNHSSFVVMKFFPLKTKLEKNASLRKHEDIDFLIPFNEFKTISKILLSEGYKYYPENKPIGGIKHIPYEDFYFPDNEELFIKNNHNVELHLTIIDVFGYYPPLVPTKKEIIKITQGLYNSARLSNFLGTKVKTFPPTQLLISLFLHSFFHHNLQSRIDFYEASELLNKFGKRINWRYIFKFIDDFNLKQYFLWYCCLLNELHPGFFPKGYLKALQNYKNSLNICQVLLFWTYKYKVFHPTKTFENPERRLENELFWSVIKGKLLRLILHRIRGLKYPYFKN